VNPLDRRAGPGVEDAEAFSTDVNKDRVTVAAVDPQAVLRLTAGAMQPVRVQKPDQLLITAFFVREVCGL
jgi:hypothetical protein